MGIVNEAPAEQTNADTEQVPADAEGPIGADAAIASMSGSTSQPNFRMIEGYEDHGVEVLFLQQNLVK
jgi:pyruvate carboxylase